MMGSLRGGLGVGCAAAAFSEAGVVIVTNKQEIRGSVRWSVAGVDQCKANSVWCDLRSKARLPLQCVTPY